MSEEQTHDYPGKEITVTWDGRLCIHIGECGYSEGDLFVGGRDPWCKPDESTVDYTIEVVKRCPSGALSYRCADGSVEDAPAAENSVQLVYNGPLFLEGDLDIAAAGDDMPSTKFRAALCRCGASKNKPFCDNSHVEAGFQDMGACGKKGSELESTGGKLSVTTLKDGPLMIKGYFRIVASSGRIAWSGEQAALCRCGASKNKPFCDGSHNGIGFTAD